MISYQKTARVHCVNSRVVDRPVHDEESPFLLLPMQMTSDHGLWHWQPESLIEACFLPDRKYYQAASLCKGCEALEVWCYTSLAHTPTAEPGRPELPLCSGIAPVRLSWSKPLCIYATAKLQEQKGCICMLMKQCFGGVEPAC